MAGITPLNLGGSKPTGNSKPVSSIGRVQSERSKPTSSIARSMSANSAAAPTTSVFRQGAHMKATSSIARAVRASDSAPTTSVQSQAKRSVFDTGYEEGSEDMQEKRYERARSIAIENRKKKQAEAEKHAETSGSGSRSWHLKKGAQFKEKGAFGFRKKLWQKTRYKKHLSKDDRKMLGDMVAGVVKKKRVGGRISDYKKKLMRREAKKAWKQDKKISKADYGTFKKVIDEID